MCSRKLVDELLKKVAEYAKLVFCDKLEKVVLYGSYARGDYDDESDIDVMIFVDMSPEELWSHRKKINHFCSELNIENNVFISPKLQSVSIFEQRKNIIPFYMNVAREGINI